MTGIQRQLAAAALTAAERGWRVFPLRPDDKRPAVRDWQERATCDPARVRDCWASGSYNVGIACGPSGLVVVDLDVPKEDDGTHPGAIGRQARSGYDALTELAHRRGEVVPAETYTVTTRSGGTHLYFRAPAGEPLRNSAGRIGRLVDTRADGGYVVGAGSVVGGRPYRVTRYSPVAELPTWLAEAARPPRSTGTAPGGSVADLRHESATRRPRCAPRSSCRSQARNRTRLKITIESLNARFRAATRRRGHFPDEQSALKVLYLAARKREKNRPNPTGQIPGWKSILNTLSLTYGDRLGLK